MSDKIVGAVSIGRADTSWIVLKARPHVGVPGLNERDIMETGSASNWGKDYIEVVKDVSARLRPYNCSGMTVSSFGPFLHEIGMGIDRGDEVVISTHQTALHAGGINVSSAFKQCAGIKPEIITDATAVALGEFVTRYWRRDAPFRHLDEEGVAYKRKIVASLILGHGVGGGFVIGGQPVPFTYHPEMGHLPVTKLEKEPRDCACRVHRDCAEGFLGRQTLNAEGDRLSFLGLHQFAYYAAQLCESITYMLGPDVITLAGSTIRDYPETIPMIREELAMRLRGRNVTEKPLIAQEDIAGLPDYISQAERSSYLLGTVLHAIRGVQTS